MLQIFFFGPVTFLAFECLYTSRVQNIYCFLVSITFFVVILIRNCISSFSRTAASWNIVNDSTCFIKTISFFSHVSSSLKLLRQSTFFPPFCHSEVYLDYSI